MYILDEIHRIKQNTGHQYRRLRFGVSSITLALAAVSEGFLLRKTPGGACAPQASVMTTRNGRAYLDQAFTPEDEQTGFKVNNTRR